MYYTIINNASTAKSLSQSIGLSDIYKIVGLHAVSYTHLTLPTIYSV